MTMKGNNVVEMVQPAPDCLNISREAWAKTPAVVRDEILRMHGELAKGIEKYRPAAERDAGLAEYHGLAAKSGKNLRDVIGGYVAMEHVFRVENIGIDPKKVAAQALAAEPEAVA
jgi:hypothetical protein